MKYLLLLTCFLRSPESVDNAVLIVSWNLDVVPNVTYEDSRFTTIENEKRDYSKIVSNQLSIMSEYSKKILVMQHENELIVLRDDLASFSLNLNTNFEKLQPSKNIHLFLNLVNYFFPVKYDDANFVSIPDNTTQKEYLTYTILQCVRLMESNFYGIKTMIAVATSERFGLVVRQDGRFYQIELHPNAIQKIS